MGNPFFKVMGNWQNHMMAQFQQFMQQMQGQNPNAIIQNMLQSGKLSQAQLDQAQQQAMQMQGIFAQFFNK